MAQPTLKAKCISVETISGASVPRYRYTYELSADGGSTAVSNATIESSVALINVALDSISQFCPTVGSGL